MRLEGMGGPMFDTRSFAALLTMRPAQDLVGGSSAQLGLLVRDDFAKYERLTKDLNINVN
jgi:hypothetical protein